MHDMSSQRRVVHLFKNIAMMVVRRGSWMRRVKGGEGDRFTRRGLKEQLRSNGLGPSKTKSPPESRLDNGMVDWGPIEQARTLVGRGST